MYPPLIYCQYINNFIFVNLDVSGPIDYAKADYQTNTYSLINVCTKVLYLILVIIMKAALNCDMTTRAAESSFENNLVSFLSKKIGTTR